MTCRGDVPSCSRASGTPSPLGKRIEEAEQALAYLQELHELGDVPAILLAYPCVGLGDHDQAFEWLEKGFEEHAALLVTLKVVAGQ
jgi:hypothetical protein